MRNYITLALEEARMETDRDELPIGTLGTSFRLIEALETRERAGVTELARELDISKGTVHKHLSSLETLGYVVSEEGTYRLGLRFLGVGERVRSRNSLYLAAKSAIDDLADTTGTVVNLMIHECGYGLYAYRAGTEDGADDFLPPVGDVVPIHATAGGKAILSQLPRERIDEMLERRGLPPRTDKTITDRTELNRALRSVRDRGLAFERGEHLPSIQCVAAPITTPDGDVGAITVAGNVDRLTGKKLEEDVAGLVVSTSNAVEVSLLRGR